MSLRGACGVTPGAVRDALATNWGRFCLAMFADAQACADFFDVTRQCAWNWMESDRHRPSGHHVTFAILRFGPDLAAFLAGAGGQDATGARRSEDGRSYPALRVAA